MSEIEIAGKFKLKSTGEKTPQETNAIITVSLRIELNGHWAKWWAIMAPIIIYRN